MAKPVNHVAIIMDGNGRWAKGRGRPRVWGHTRGSSVVSHIVETASDLGLGALTLYAFSTENWSRPKSEIGILFKLLKKFLLKERARIIRNAIQFKVIGNKQSIPAETLAIVDDLEQTTKDFKGLKLRFAFDYGSQAEIIRAANQFMAAHPGQQLTAEGLGQYLFDPESGDVDLLIRTSGEQRISNFLLWQIAYAELFFTHTLWPDFTATEFVQILDAFAGRDRRFGATASSLDLSSVQKLSQQQKAQMGVDQHV